MGHLLRSLLLWNRLLHTTEMSSLSGGGSEGESELIKLTDQQIAQCKGAFEHYDKGEGLEVAKLLDAFKKMGQNVTSEFLEKHEEEVDKDGHGFINYDEFELLVRKKIREEEDEKELKDVFRILDKEKKGEIHTDEIKWILKGLGDELTEDEIDEMIAEVDSDGSGWVDFDEFKGLMMGD